MTAERSVVFERVGKQWIGTLDGAGIAFGHEHAGAVYEHMQELHPSVRVGFKASDIGDMVAKLVSPESDGVLWMKTKAERL